MNDDTNQVRHEVKEPCPKCEVLKILKRDLFELEAIIKNHPDDFEEDWNGYVGRAVGGLKMAIAALEMP